MSTFNFTPSDSGDKTPPSGSASSLFKRDTQRDPEPDPFSAFKTEWRSQAVDEPPPRRDVRGLLVAASGLVVAVLVGFYVYGTRSSAPQPASDALEVTEGGAPPPAAGMPSTPVNARTTGAPSALGATPPLRQRGGGSAGAETAGPTIAAAPVTAGESSVPAATAVGFLSINARPWADVWVDGQSVGTTPLANLRVASGSHEVIWRHPQFGERRQTVDVGVTGPTRVGINFRD